jgi:GT2 family glycosyltransferase
VALVDDDQRAEKGYLMAICDAAQRYPEADMFCGRLLPDWDGTEPRWIHETGAYRIYPTPVPHFDIGDEPKRIMSGMKIPSGGNLVLRRDLFSRVGPFSLELGPQGHDLGGAEDIEWIRRALSINAHLQYIPNMMQFHHVDPDRVTLHYLIKKAYERSASTSRFIWARREQVRLPAYMYRKTMNYFALALSSLNAQRRRFYLIRLAATLGEIKGFRQCRKRSSRHSAGTST